MATATNHNAEMNLAWQFLASTNVNVFLTGKAGTGKTTFLRRIRQLSPKRMVVVAPTGVAAINAQGMTIHSFFQISPGVFIPNTEKKNYYHVSNEKKRILRTIDLLVIDEISMVRADLLDAIDEVLRKYQNRNLPFGGVQLLLIGDLQQLAPVATDREWALLRTYYDTPYFFSSKALGQTRFVTIELQHIYRQNDQQFINLLSNIREGRLDTDTVAQLNRRYIPGYEPQEDDECIRLTTHNAKAQQYNRQRLLALPGKAFTFHSTVEKDFPESSYPADEELTLKVGAQVMFIRNDTGPDNRYYNGKIGRVTGFSPEGIRVHCNDSLTDITVTQATWKNTRISIDESTQELVEEEIGSFTQYPLRLAWSITIHKSQGLTFDRAILDINQSFAHGQVYVALSRCRSLEGLVLSQPVDIMQLAADKDVEAFIQKEKTESHLLQTRLGSLQFEYYSRLLNELFSFAPLHHALGYVVRVMSGGLSRQFLPTLSGWMNRLDAFEKDVMTVSQRFQSQYTTLLTSQADYTRNERLQERIKAAASYFVKQLQPLTVLLAEGQQLLQFIANKTTKKQLSNALDLFALELQTKTGTMEKTCTEGFSTGSYLKNKAQAILESEKNEKKKTRRRTAKKTARTDGDA